MTFGSKLSKLGVSATAIVVLVAGAFSQGEPPRVPAPIPPVRPPAVIAVPPSDDRHAMEKRLIVDPSIAIKLPCVVAGHISVNGWSRAEVRIFVTDGSPIAFNVNEKDARSGNPSWVLVTREPIAAATADRSNCISGDRIEIDAPETATLTLSGRNTDIDVDSVGRVDIKNVSGDVSIRRVTGGISAGTFQGDLTVGSSSGQIELEATNGDIVAYAVGPGKGGDLFRAKTGQGSIKLQDVAHRQIEANTVSGSVIFDGEFLRSGFYSFRTVNGPMRFVIPGTSSIRVVASYGFGGIKSDLPLRTETENISPGGKSMTAILGTGDATVKLSTNNGQIRFVKKP